MAVANVFAIFYVVAQIIERIAEFLKNGFNIYDEIRANIETVTMEIEDCKTMIEHARNSGEDITVQYTRLNELIRTKNTMDNKMVQHFFLYTSILGILAAWLLQIRFLSLLGAPADPTMDIIVTGLVIGSGTKPLHDLIKYIEKAKG